MAGLSATKKYHSSNFSVYENYIKLDDIKGTTYHLDVDTKLLLEDGSVISVSSSTEIKILEYRPKVINRLYYVLVAIEDYIGYVLVTSIRKPLAHTRQYNRGEIAEGLLSASIVTCLLKFDCTVQSIQNVISMYSGVSERLIQYDNGSYLSSNINLNRMTLNFVRDLAAHDCLLGIYNALILFNQSHYVTQFFNDSNITVNSIGATNEKDVKADVIVSSNFRELNISLKCGVAKNLEQAGTSFTVISKVFLDFGLYITNEFMEYDKSVIWFKALFIMMCDQFNSKPVYQANYELSYGIIQSATRNKKNTIQLHLHDNDYTVFLYNTLFLRLNRYIFIAEYDHSTKNPRLLFKCMETGLLLISMGLEVRSARSAMTLHIVKEKLLAELTSM